jgi:hypothetical protein
MLKKSTPASPATARASSVLPVPGGPTSRTPLGTLLPLRLYFSGFRKKSTTSISSCFPSPIPATSANVMRSSRVMRTPPVSVTLRGLRLLAAPPAAASLSAATSRPRTRFAVTLRNRLASSMDRPPETGEDGRNSVGM